MIRSKFRVMNVSESHDGVLIVKMSPVMPKSKYSPEGSEDNARFWKATPSGEVLLHFNSDKMEQARSIYKPGSAHYIDIDPQGIQVEQTGAWTCEVVSFGSWQHFNIQLNPMDRAGSVSLGIDNPDAVLFLLNHVVRDFEVANKWKQEHPEPKGTERAPRQAWSVTFSPAPG